MLWMWQNWSSEKAMEVCSYIRIFLYPKVAVKTVKETSTLSQERYELDNLVDATLYIYIAI